MFSVKLICHTPEPEKLVAAAAKLCYSAADVDTLMSGLTPEKVDSFVTMLGEIGHESPIEHASFTFAIEGVSRSLLAQITRRLAINRCRDHQRARWLRMVDLRAEPETLNQWCEPPDAACAGVMEALGKLKPRYREVITLHCLQSMSAEETGHAVGLSPSAVYRRLKKAKGELKKLLEGWENDG